MMTTHAPERIGRHARRIDWEPRPGKPDWLMGTGATVTERALVHATAVAAVAVVLWTAADLAWSWWRYAVAAVMAYDLAGGVVAGGLNPAKRFYHGPVPAPPTLLRRLVHNPVGFAAVHVQPIAVGLLFDAWWWGLLWYAWALAGVILVRWTPLYLARPVGLLVVATGVMASTLVPAPAGFAWLPAILLLKLVLAHAVPEEPYGRVADHPAHPHAPAARGRG